MAPGPMEGSGRAPRQQLLRQGGEEVVDWSQVDAEVKSVPSEYREARFHPLKHVVEVFSSADPQGLTQDVSWHAPAHPSMEQPHGHPVLGIVARALQPSLLRMRLMKLSWGCSMEEWV